jgi:hypothetical protein
MTSGIFQGRSARATPETESGMTIWRTVGSVWKSFGAISFTNLQTSTDDFESSRVRAWSGTQVPSCMSPKRASASNRAASSWAVQKGKTNRSSSFACMIKADLTASRIASMSQPGGHLQVSTKWWYWHCATVGPANSEK